MNASRNAMLQLLSMKLIAYVTKGLEKIVEKEIISCIPDAVIEEIGDKRILFASNADRTALIALKTVDDLGLFLKKIEEVTDVEDVVREVQTIDFVAVKQHLGADMCEETNNFSLTVGSVGVKKFSAQGLKHIIAAKMLEGYQWHFTEFEHTHFDIRIFIDRTTAYISVRLTKESLYSRFYKTQAKPGSLKPTIAAAMVMLTVSRHQLKIVDNFCGSGTILCEAFSLGNEIYGGDIDQESVIITRNNLKNLQFTHEEHIQLLDATNTHWPNKFFDCAISNLPWDKQVAVQNITSLYEGCIREYARIVKAQGTICLLLTKPEIAVKYAKKYFPLAKIETLKISFQGQQPTMVIINR